MGQLGRFFFIKLEYVSGRIIQFQALIETWS